MKRYGITAVALILSFTSGFGVVADARALGIAQALPQADHVVVKKSAHTLVLLRHGRVIKAYPISLGREPVGPKERAGDSKTPEGDYLIDWRNPHSKFHLALHISYPGTGDRNQAERGGYAPGGAIMIHGRPNWTGWIRALYEDRDWTDGCIALSNADMDEVWAAVPDGTPITILP
jgi:murein L,D-transpeptidase YafK